MIGRATGTRSRRVLGVHRVALRFRVSRQITSKHVRERGQSVIGLVCWYMVNVGGVGEFGWPVLDVSGQGMRVVHASKCLTQWCRLDYSLGGKMFVRGSNNRKPGRCLVPTGHAWCLGGKATCVFILFCAVALGRLLLQPRLDNVPLLVAD